jgi:hypothetical protein
MPWEAFTRFIADHELRRYVLEDTAGR